MVNGFYHVAGFAPIRVEINDHSVVSSYEFYVVSGIFNFHYIWRNLLTLLNILLILSEAIQIHISLVLLQIHLKSLYHFPDRSVFVLFRLSQDVVRNSMPEEKLTGCVSEMVAIIFENVVFFESKLFFYIFEITPEIYLRDLRGSKFDFFDRCSELSTLRIGKLNSSLIKYFFSIHYYRSMPYSLYLLA